MIEELILREAPELLAYLARRVPDPADAADLLGDVLLVVWRRIASMPSDPGQARMWMFGIARKTLTGSRRTSGRRQALTDRLRHEITATSHSTDLAGVTTPDPIDPRTEQLTQAMTQLSPADQEILRLIHWDSFSLTEAGQHLRLRPTTARSRYHRARGRLRHLLELDLSEEALPTQSPR